MSYGTSFGFPVNCLKKVIGRMELIRKTHKFQHVASHLCMLHAACMWPLVGIFQTMALIVDAKQATVNIVHLKPLAAIVP